VTVGTGSNNSSSSSSNSSSNSSSRSSTNNRIKGSSLEVLQLLFYFSLGLAFIVGTDTVKPQLFIAIPLKNRLLLSTFLVNYTYNNKAIDG
jgi:hypothetical protein